MCQQHEKQYLSSYTIGYCVQFGWTFTHVLGALYCEKGVSCTMHEDRIFIHYRSHGVLIMGVGPRACESVDREKNNIFRAGGCDGTRGAKSEHTCSLLGDANKHTYTRTCTLCPHSLLSLFLPTHS